VPPSPPHGELLLIAARVAKLSDLVERHETVEAIVIRHGGFYDGGESGWLNSRTGEPVRQADPRPGE
jgi:hypothetical protein